MPCALALEEGFGQSGAVCRVCGGDGSRWWWRRLRVERCLSVAFRMACLPSHGTGWITRTKFRPPRSSMWALSFFSLFKTTGPRLVGASVFDVFPLENHKLLACIFSIPFIVPAVAVIVEVEGPTVPNPQ